MNSMLVLVLRSVCTRMTRFIVPATFGLMVTVRMWTVLLSESGSRMVKSLAEPLMLTIRNGSLLRTTTWRSVSAPALMSPSCTFIGPAGVAGAAGVVGVGVSSGLVGVATGAAGPGSISTVTGT